MEVIITFSMAYSHSTWQFYFRTIYFGGRWTWRSGPAGL